MRPLGGMRLRDGDSGRRWVVTVTGRRWARTWLLDAWSKEYARDPVRAQVGRRVDAKVRSAIRQTIGRIP